MTSRYFLLLMYLYYIFSVFIHLLLCLSFCACALGSTTGHFPRTRHRRKPLCYDINRIILNQISQHSGAELRENVLSALKGRGRESERDIERVSGRNVLLSLHRNKDAAHFANWLRRPQFCSISALTRPSLWEIYSWSLILQGCFVIYDLEGCVPIWDSSHCRTGDLRVQWHHWLLSDAEEKWTQFVFSHFSIFKTWTEHCGVPEPRFGCLSASSITGVRLWTHTG